MAPGRVRVESDTVPHKRLAVGQAATNLHILRGLFTERLEDVALGAGIALIGTMMAFPRTSTDEFA